MASNATPDSDEPAAGVDGLGAYEVIDRLLGIRDAGTATPTHLAVPASAPKFLVPCPVSTATRSLRAYGALRAPGRRVQRLAMVAALRTPVVSRLVATPVVVGERAPELIERLRGLIGEESLVFGLGLPPADAWWKPTLQLFDRRGVPAGFAKVGHRPLTASLVDNEADALARLRLSGDVHAPAALGRFSWNDMPVSVTAPMPGDVSRPVQNEEPDIRGLAELMRTPTPDAGDADLRWTRWCDHVRRAVAGAPAASEVAAVGLDALGPGTERSVACAHGDWVPWNMADARDGRWVWDFEYFAEDAPAGFDVAHWVYQHHRVLKGRSASEALLATFTDADPSRWRWAESCDGVGLDRDAMAALRLAHPLHLMARFAAAVRAGAPAGHDLAAMVDWVRRCVESESARP